MIQPTPPSLTNLTCSLLMQELSALRRRVESANTHLIDIDAVAGTLAERIIYW